MSAPTGGAASGFIPLDMLSEPGKALALIRAAKLYDYQHFRDGGLRGNWGSVPDEQVLRLLTGAFRELEALTAAALLEES